MNTIKDKSDAEERRKALLKEGSEVKEEDAKDVEKEGNEGGQEGYEDEDAQTENASGSDDQAIHVWIRCDGCKMNPLVGVRYKCLEWVFPRIARAPFANDLVSFVALSALITICARAAKRKVSIPLNIVC